jgi:magnesium-transporting ATPase (P-type)
MYIRNFKNRGENSNDLGEIMDSNEVLTMFNIIGLFWILFIIISFSLSAFWNIKFIYKTKWQGYSWIKLYAAITSILVVLAYFYILFNSVFYQITNPDFFGVMVIRPIFILVGGVLASSARARITSLKGGGEKWILKTYRG